jgi:hypothetical protein
VSEVAFGAEISQDRQHCAIVAAGREQDGTRVLIDLVWYDHPRGAVARLVSLSAAHDPVAVAVDGRSQSATLIRPLADEGIVAVQLATADVAVAHGEFLDLVTNGGLAHLDQPPMTAAVRAAQQRPLAGAAAWERKVAVDQSPLVAATEAVWAFLRWVELSSPGVFAI